MAGMAGKSFGVAQGAPPVEPMIVEAESTISEVPASFDISYLWEQPLDVIGWAGGLTASDVFVLALALSAVVTVATSRRQLLALAGGLTVLHPVLTAAPSWGGDLAMALSILWRVAITTLALVGATTLLLAARARLTERQQATEQPAAEVTTA